MSKKAEIVIIQREDHLDVIFPYTVGQAVKTIKITESELPEWVRAEKPDSVKFYWKSEKPKS